MRYLYFSSIKPFAWQNLNSITSCSPIYLFVFLLSLPNTSEVFFYLEEFFQSMLIFSETSNAMIFCFKMKIVFLEGVSVYLFSPLFDDFGLFNLVKFYECFILSWIAFLYQMRDGHARTVQLPFLFIFQEFFCLLFWF